MLYTLLPQINFYDSFSKMDPKTLARQRLDASALFKTLIRPTVDNPDYAAQVAVSRAAHAWRGYEYGLSIYAMQASKAWREAVQGRDALTPVIVNMLRANNKDWDYKLPPWIGDINIHRSHRAFLVRKDPDFYGNVWPGTDPLLPILWPHNDLQDKSDPYTYRVSNDSLARIKRGVLRLPAGWKVEGDGSVIVD